LLERFSMLVNAARLFSFVSLVLFHTTVTAAPTSVGEESVAALQMISLIPRSEYRAGMVIGREDLASVVIAACRSDAPNRVFTVTNADGVVSDGWLSRFADLSADLNLPPE
jgi:hypothetical protein